MMIKVVRDLWSLRVQALFMVVALSAGLLSLGTIASSQAVLKREMTRAYVDTSPASATLDLGRPVDEASLRAVRQHPAVAAAERHGMLHTTWRWPDGDPGRALLFVRDELAQAAMNKVRLEAGRFPTRPGEVVLERDAARFVAADIGAHLELDGVVVSVVGIVHDPALPPAASEQAIYVYGTPATLSDIDVVLDRVGLLVATDGADPRAVDRQVAAVASTLPGLHRIDIPPPGRHPHQGPTDAVLTMFILFGALTFGLSALVARSLLETILVRESRQIAVLRALGATRAQVQGMYLSMMGAIAAVSTAISLALLRTCVDATVGTLTVLLNFDIADGSIPWTLWGGLVLTGVGLPALLALPSIRRAAHRDVVATIRDHGTPSTTQPPRRVLGSRLLSAGVGNAFRNRRRLVLTVAMLAVAGGLFVAAGSMSDAWNAVTHRVLEDRDYAVQVHVDRSLSVVPSPLELWGEVPATVDFVDGLPISRTYPDGGHGTFRLVASPEVPTTETFHIREGRWHGSDDEVVLNQTAHRDLGHPALGSTVDIAVEGELHVLRVVGIVEVVAAPASAYVSHRMFSTVGLPLSVIRSPGDTTTLDGFLRTEGLGVERRVPTELVFNAMGEHVEVLVAAMGVISILMGIVGSIALSSSLAISVLERRRELAVLRAMGARRAQIVVMLATEGLFMAGVALPLALVVAIPVAASMGRVVGWLAFQIPLPLDVSWSALGVWSLASLLFAVVASVVPARNALDNDVCDGLREV